MNNLVTSFVRTYVPLAIGWLVVRFGLDIDSAAVASSAVALVSAVWYAAARLIESRWPRAGWMLGRPTPPSY